MTLTKKLALPALFALMFLTGLAFALTNNAKASAGTLPATIWKQTLVNASSTAGLVIATSSPVCASRIVSTASSSVMIQFTEAFGGNPSANSGIQQAGSTTVAYDAAQYGCGAMRIYSFSNQVVTVLTAN